MKKKIILCGNAMQFNNWCEENGETSGTVIYGADAYSLLGREASDVIVYGTFWDRKDARDLYELAKSRVR